MAELSIDAILKMAEQLQRVSERAGTLAEAEAAAVKLQEMLLKYNLSSADLSREAEKRANTVKMQRVRMRYNESWRGLLLACVTRAHMGRCVRSLGNQVTGKPTIYTVFAHAHNLIVIKATYLWLLEEIGRLSSTGHSNAVANGEIDAIKRGVQWQIDFKIGAVDGLEDAYTAARKKLEQSTAAEAWALVPVMEREVDAALERAFPNVGSGSWGRAAGTGGYAPGRAAGRGINVDRQVGSAARGAIRG